MVQQVMMMLSQQQAAQGGNVSAITPVKAPAFQPAPSSAKPSDILPLDKDERGFGEF